MDTITDGTLSLFWKFIDILADTGLFTAKPYLLLFRRAHRDALHSEDSKNRRSYPNRARVCLPCGLSFVAFANLRIFRNIKEPPFRAASFIFLSFPVR